MLYRHLNMLDLLYLNYITKQNEQLDLLACMCKLTKKSVMYLHITLIK